MHENWINRLIFLNGAQSDAAPNHTPLQINGAQSDAAPNLNGAQSSDSPSVSGFYLSNYTMNALTQVSAHTTNVQLPAGVNDKN